MDFDFLAELFHDDFEAPDSRLPTTSVVFTPELLTKIDGFAKSLGKSRSFVIRVLLEKAFIHMEEEAEANERQLQQFLERQKQEENGRAKA